MSYSKILHESLREGDMKRLALEIEGRSDKSFERVYSYISEARDGGRYFDVAALTVELHTPLLRQIADRAGFLLVEKPKADAEASLADVARSGGEVVATFMQAFADGQITPTELVAIQHLCAIYQGQLARLVSHAEVLSGGAKP